jgi:hypothetical protein
MLSVREAHRGWCAVLHALRIGGGAAGGKCALYGDASEAGGPAVGGILDDLRHLHVLLLVLFGFLAHAEEFRPRAVVDLAVLAAALVRLFHSTAAEGLCGSAGREISCGSLESTGGIRQWPVGSLPQA